jgi:hypothetical protein
MADVSRWVDRTAFDEVATILEQGSRTRTPAQPGPRSRGCPETRGSVFGTAMAIFRAFGSPRVRQATSCTPGDITQTLSIVELLKNNGTLYLVAPEYEQAELRPLFVALVQAVYRTAVELSANLLQGAPLTPPLLMMLDEAGNIAPLKTLPTIASTGAGQGITLMTIWQDRAQIRAIYGDNERTVIANHTTTVWLPGTQDLDTLKLLSDLIGDQWVASSTISAAPDGGLSVSEGSERIDVAPPAFLRTLPHGNAVMLTGNLPPRSSPPTATTSSTAGADTSPTTCSTSTAGSTARPAPPPARSSTSEAGPTTCPPPRPTRSPTTSSKPQARRTTTGKRTTGPTLSCSATATSATCGSPPATRSPISCRCREDVAPYPAARAGRGHLRASRRRPRRCPHPPCGPADLARDRPRRHDRRTPHLPPAARRMAPPRPHRRAPRMLGSLHPATRCRRPPRPSRHRTGSRLKEQPMASDTTLASSGSRSTTAPGSPNPPTSSAGSPPTTSTPRGWPDPTPGTPGASPSRHPPTATSASSSRPAPSKRR